MVFPIQHCLVTLVLEATLWFHELYCYLIELACYWRSAQWFRALIFGEASPNILRRPTPNMPHESFSSDRGNDLDVPLACPSPIPYTHGSTFSDSSRCPWCLRRISSDTFWTLGPIPSHLGADPWTRAVFLTLQQIHTMPLFWKFYRYFRICRMRYDSHCPSKAGSSFPNNSQSKYKTCNVAVMIY